MGKVTPGGQARLAPRSAHWCLNLLITDIMLNYGTTENAVLRSCGSLAPRMVLRVKRAKSLPCNVGVDFRRADVRMAKHGLNCAEVCAMYEQVRREGVPECVW